MSDSVNEVIESRGTSNYKDIMRIQGEIISSLESGNKEIDVARKAYFNLVAHKLARLACGHGSDEDNLLDIAGYSELERRALNGEI